MANLVTKFSKYHSKFGSTLESSHPDVIITPDGRIIRVDQDIREDIMASSISHKANEYYYFGNDNTVGFKILRQWDNDCNRSGSSIKWKIPKGNIVRWYKWNENSMSDVIEEEKII